VDQKDVTACDNGDQIFIAMAYYDGTTLREVMDDGREGGQPLEFARAIDIARQVAVGLGAAHSKGIVHRDVKPENIVITDSGRVVLLDFGIAKLAGGTQFTADGATLGTVAYMAPEQARGIKVDGRTDMWATGVVLFEMLAGVRPFRGDYDQAVLYSILNEEPSSLDELDERIRPTVERALSKDVDDRFATMSDFADALDLALSGTISAEPADLAGRWRPRTIITAAAILAFVAAVAVWSSYGPGRRAESVGGPAIGVSSVSFHQVTTAAELEDFPALSPDGDRIVLSREVGGYRRLFLHDRNSGSEVQLTDEDRDDIQAVWSTDGKSIVFVRASGASGKIEPGDIYGTYVGGDIWKLDLETRRVRRLIEEAFNPAFSPDGEMLAFDAAWSGTSQRLWIADNEGRNAQQISTDASEETDHVRPRWSPDGRFLVFQTQRRTKLDIQLLDLASREISSVTDDAHQNVNPVFAGGPGGIAFSSDRGGGMNIWYVRVNSDGLANAAPRQISTGAGSDVELSSSADGARLVYSVLGINADLWRLQMDPTAGVATGQPEVLVSSTREDSRGSWSHNDSTIAFNSDRTGDMNVWLYSVVDGSTRQLTHGPGGDYQPFWSPNDSAIVFFSARSGSPDIWKVDVATGTLFQLTGDESVDINPCYSPDGEHIAYLSDLGGRREVWVMNADGSDQRPLTTTGAGGHFLRWMPDGDRIVFAAEGLAWTVALDGSEPETLVDVYGGAHMSFSPDFTLIADVSGHKVVWITPVDGRAPFVGYASEDLEIRIDYPVWSNDGQWLLFDRVKPRGGDIWMLDLVSADS
jgi:Tol biopolymer transport system component